MKVFPALGLGLLLQLAQLATGEVVEFNRELAVSYANPTGVTFLPSNADPVPGSLLMALRANGEFEKPPYACSSNDVAASFSKNLTVVVAASKCLKDDEIQLIYKWVKGAFSWSDGTAILWDLEAVVVPGDCGDAPPSHDSDYGAKVPQAMLMSNEVLASDLARFSSVFGGAARALGAQLKAEGNAEPVATPIAMISFVDNPLSFGLVDQYERMFKVSSYYNFQLCRVSQTWCQDNFGTVQLSAIEEIFMYNSYTISRQIDCAANLPGGVPVSFVDDKGDRDCFCSCTAGFEKTTEEDKTVCTKVASDVCPCVWSDHSPGYELAVTKKEQAAGVANVCRITDLASAWKVPVPFPQDNYVADSRVNQNDPSGPTGLAPLGPQITLLGDDSLEDGPHIDFTAAFANGTRVNSLLYAWKDFQEDRQRKIDLMEFSSYGKYALKLGAKDYTNETTCEGCVAIVDQFRPRATTVCPANYTGDCAVPEMTTDTLIKAQDLLTNFYEFGELADNDACSSDPSVRCDVQVLKAQDFFESEASVKPFSEGKDFFQLGTMIGAFVEKSKTQPNPLANPENAAEAKNCAEPVPEGHCTRCVALATTLKEKWTNYTCGAAAEDEIEQCDGSDSCEFKQCLVLHGDTFASVTAEINADVKATSQAILDQLPDKEFLQTETQIHRSVQCANLHDPNTTLECSFEGNLNELLNITASVDLGEGEGVNVDDYVFWRYRVGNGDWKLWNAGANETFVDAKTDIHLEAWTQCGKVHSFCFSVHLHPHSDVAVCQFFSNMWYQTSVSRLPIDADVCTYPKSDFAELTFDYHPNIGLMYARDKLRMNISQVVCELAFNDHTPAEILNVTQDSPEIVTRFAVEALNNAKTDAFTKFSVTCYFTYKQFGGHEVQKKCEKPFSVKDCTPPVIDDPKPPVGECEFDNCAGKDLPGPYEACAGILVRAAPSYIEEGDMVFPAKTYTTSGKRECCSSCKDEKLMCTAILDLPDAEDNIMRCELPPPDAYGNPYDSYNSNPYQTHDTYESSSTLMSVGHALITASQEHVGVTALLGVSALVALVALVVVKRHRRAASKADETLDDVYYPLLH